MPQRQEIPYGNVELRNLETFNRVIVGGPSFNQFISSLRAPKGSSAISYNDAVDTYRSSIEHNFARLQGMKTGPANRGDIRNIFNDAYYNYFLKKRDPMEKYKVYNKYDENIKRQKKQVPKANIENAIMNGMKKLEEFRI